jgi:hypothetical protein
MARRCLPGRLSRYLNSPNMQPRLPRNNPERLVFIAHRTRPISTTVPSMWRECQRRPGAGRDAVRYEEGPATLNNLVEGAPKRISSLVCHGGMQSDKPQRLEARTARGHCRGKRLVDRTKELSDPPLLLLVLAPVKRRSRQRWRCAGRRVHNWPKWACRPWPYKDVSDCERVHAGLLHALGETGRSTGP